MEDVIVFWSGGKDSGLALHEILKTDNYGISSLITIVTEEYQRINIHGVRQILLERQSDSLGYPIEKLFIPKKASMEEYESIMRNSLIKYAKSGISSVVYGDIFLEDIRRYREDQLSKFGMVGIFPIWKRDTLELANTFIETGFKAIITCIDSNILDKGFVGRLYDKQFLFDLPFGVDPCGENGEFHSFLYGGPLFDYDILFEKGDVVFRENRFYYCDLIPV